MLEKYKQLPVDVVNIIFEYCGLLVKRNGKLMRLIPKTDVRYKTLLNAYKKEKLTIFNNDSRFYIRLFLSDSIYLIHDYYFFSRKHTLTICHTKYSYLDYFYMLLCIMLPITILPSKTLHYQHIYT